MLKNRPRKNSRLAKGTCVKQAMDGVRIRIFECPSIFRYPTLQTLLQKVSELHSSLPLSTVHFDFLYLTTSDARKIDLDIPGTPLHVIWCTGQ